MIYAAERGTVGMLSMLMNTSGVDIHQPDQVKHCHHFPYRLICGCNFALNPLCSLACYNIWVLQAGKTAFMYAAGGVGQNDVVNFLLRRVDGMVKHINDVDQVKPSQ